MHLLNTINRLLEIYRHLRSSFSPEGAPKQRAATPNSGAPCGFRRCLGRAPNRRTGAGHRLPVEPMGFESTNYMKTKELCGAPWSSKVLKRIRGILSAPLLLPRKRVDS